MLQNNLIKNLVNNICETTFTSFTITGKSITDSQFKTYFHLQPVQMKLRYYHFTQGIRQNEQTRLDRDRVCNKSGHKHFNCRQHHCELGTRLNLNWTCFTDMRTL